MNFHRRSFVVAGGTSLLTTAWYRICFPVSQDKFLESIQGSGNFDVVYNDSLAKQIHWTTRDFHGKVISYPLLTEGDSISHSKNPLLTWNFHNKIRFESTEQTSQIDETFFIATEEAARGVFQSLAILKNDEGQLSLVGVLNLDHLFHDPDFPLLNYDAQSDSLSFHGAIRNFHASDAFTGILTSQRFFIVFALNSQGMPRILFSLDRYDENQNTFDAGLPNVHFDEKFEISLPRYNLGNDGQYSVFWRGLKHGLFLMNVQENGLKIICDFSKVESADAHFLEFPEDDFSWHFASQSREHLPADFFLHALHNMGPTKESLMHWRLQDGHHVFCALHPGSNGQYQIVPRTFLRAFDKISEDTNWILHPFDHVTTAVSQTHDSAPDQLVFWNRRKGCCFLSLEYGPAGKCHAKVGKHFAVDERFHTSSDHSFNSDDVFFNDNSALTPRKRVQRAQFFHQSCAVQTGVSEAVLAEQKHSQAPRYRLHVFSPSQAKTVSVDYASGDAHLFSLTAISQGENWNALKCSSSRELPEAKTAAQGFWNDFRDHFVKIGRAPDFFGADEHIFNDEIAKAAATYRDQYGASSDWLQSFRDHINRLAGVYRHRNPLVGGSERAATIGVLVFGLGSIALLCGAGLIYEAHSKRILSNQLAVFSQAEKNIWTDMPSAVNGEENYSDFCKHFQPLMKQSSEINDLESCASRFQLFKNVLEEARSELAAGMLDTASKITKQVENMQNHLSNMEQFLRNSGKICRPAAALAATFFVGSLAAAIYFFPEISA